MRIRKLLGGALCALGAALALSLNESALSAQQAACDFVTGGGYIHPQAFMSGKGTFGVAGGCKNGSFWGHLQYKDHAVGKQIHGTSITGYQMTADNARLICGTGRTPQGDVTFVVRVKDAGEPGSEDEFDIEWEGAGGTYPTDPSGFPHKLAAGNILLHKPNNSNTGMFGTCPSIGPAQGITVNVTLVSQPSEGFSPGGTVTSAPAGIDCHIDSSTDVPATQSGDCFASFEESSVLLTATALDGANAVFTSGCASQSGPGPTATCTVTGSVNEVIVTFTFQE